MRKILAMLLALVLSLSLCACGGDASDEEENKTNVINVQTGEAATSDTFEFTVNNVQFAERLSLEAGKLYIPAPGVTGSALVAGDGQTYVVVELSVKNMSKEDVNPQDLFDAMRINYADGYLYDQSDAAWLDSAVPMDGVFMIEPLTTDNYRITFKCSAEVMSGEAPLSLDANLFMNGEETVYKLDIKQFIEE